MLVSRCAVNSLVCIYFRDQFNPTDEGRAQREGKKERERERERL